MVRALGFWNHYRGHDGNLHEIIGSDWKTG